MNSKLQEAVAVFKELGWEEATPENIAELPLGTAEQKRTALAGLKSGEWLEWVKEGNTLSTRYVFDVDAGMLALFAVRIGVDARRASNILSSGNNLFSRSNMVIDVIASRGEKYALDFIGFACNSRRRAWEHSASSFGNVAVQLVDRMDLDIPQSVEYMKDWSVYAAAALGLKAETFFRDTNLPVLEMIERRFGEHILTGVEVNTPATGPFGEVLPAGVKRGWLPREKAVDLVFSALDAAVRPGDRKVWLDVLDQFAVSDEELFARIQSLIPLMASGDSFVVERLAPAFIIGAEENLLAEVLTAAFSVTTKKTRQLVLRAALNRSRPENTDELAPWLSILASDKDKTVAALSSKLIKHWSVAAETLTNEGGEVQGLWQETPPLWKVPSFELGEVSPEALTELATEMVRRPGTVHDVTTERFLAVANTVAYEDPEAARASLRGLRSGSLSQLLTFILCWTKGETPKWGFDENKNRGTKEPLAARDMIVCLNLGSQPCLLSTPSMDDLSITIPDLASRLMLYKKAGAAVQEADLFLALTRLDLNTKTQEAIQTLGKMDVRVLLQSGKKMPVTAGKATITFLDNPLVESSSQENKSWWRDINIPTRKSLPGFPERFDSYQHELYSVLPNWGDVSLHAARWDSEVYHEKGLILRQIARRAAPLPPGAAINFLAAQRSSTPAAAADSMLSVTEAWERGLLRPGIADIGLLDWSESEPSNLGALASALEGMAGDGMLSVVWPILDQLICASLKAPRLLSGTAELSELIEMFLPEAESAIKRGLADKSAFFLPGIRQLAKRGGSSRTVSAAKKIAERLQPLETEPVDESATAPVMDTPFEDLWPARPEKTVIIDDGVELTVDWADPDSPKKLFLFTLTLPGISDRVFQVVKNGWHYDLETEGQCEARFAAPGMTVYKRDRENQAWLHWDAGKNAMVVCKNRNWADGKDGPLNDLFRQKDLSGKKVPIPPLPLSLLTIVIGLLAQAEVSVYYLPNLLTHLIKSRQIDAEVVRRATRTLLKYPVVSPAKLVRSLERDIKLLPVLWPMLTECVKAAGTLVRAGEKPPVWINRVLDISVRYAPYLKEAAKRGLIPVEDAGWEGLSDIASSKTKSTAIAKAQTLQALIKKT